MAYATVQDVEARLGRPLSADEEAQVEVLLEDVETLIKTRIPDLDQKITDGTISEHLIVMIEVAAVIRVLRNPDAFISETDGNYSYTRSTSGASGYLDLLPQEWDWILGPGNMFQLVPVPAWDQPGEGFTWQPDAHKFYPPSWGWTVRVP